MHEFQKFYFYLFSTILLILVNNNEHKLTSADVKPPLGSQCSPLPCRPEHGHNIWHQLIEAFKWSPMIKSVAPVTMMGLTNLALLIKLGIISKKGINVRVKNDPSQKRTRGTLTVFIKNRNTQKENEEIGGDGREKDYLDHLSKEIGVDLTGKRKDNGKYKKNDQNLIVQETGRHSESGDLYWLKTHGIPNGVGYKPVYFMRAMPVQYPIIGQSGVDYHQTSESKPTAVWIDPIVNSNPMSPQMIPRIPEIQGNVRPLFNSNNGYENQLNYIEPNDVEVYSSVDKFNQDNNYYMDEHRTNFW